MESTMSLTKAKSNAWERTKQKPWLCFKSKRKRGFEPCTLKPFKTHYHLCVKLHKPGHFLHGNGYEEKQRVSQWEKIIIPPTEVQSWDHIRGPSYEHWLPFLWFVWLKAGKSFFCLFNQRDAFYIPMWVNKYSLQQSAKQILFIFRAVNVNNVWPSLGERRREINKSNQTRLKWQLHLLSHRIWKCKQ